MTAQASHLIPPHGGELINLLVYPDRATELKSHSREWASWDLTPRQICDLELLISGGFSRAAEALKRMNEAQPPVTVLFVVEEDRPVGVLHVHDLLRAGVM